MAQEENGTQDTPLLWKEILFKQRDGLKAVLSECKKADLEGPCPGAALVESPAPRPPHSSALAELLHQEHTRAAGVKGLYMLQGGEANLLVSRCARWLPSEQPKLAHSFLALPCSGCLILLRPCPGSVHLLMWKDGSPCFGEASQHTSILVCWFLQAAKPQYVFKTRQF